MAFEQGGALVNPGAKLTSPTITTPTFAVGQIGAPKLAVVSLLGTSIHARVSSWALPENALIKQVTLYVSTVATAAATLSIGYTATSAITAANNLITGLDVNAATGVFDSVTDKGASGVPEGVIGLKSKWITISETSGDTTGMVATLYILYWPSAA